jgi:hypothetical protein
MNRSITKGLTAHASVELRTGVRDRSLCREVS